MIQRIGNYEGHNIALIDDSIAEILPLTGLQHRVIPSEDVALCYKFAGIERDHTSVKKGDDGDTVDPHIQQICNSMEDLEEGVEKVKYYFTDDDKVNIVKFLQFFMRFVLDGYYEHRLKTNTLEC